MCVLVPYGIWRGFWVQRFTEDVLAYLEQTRPFSKETLVQRLHLLVLDESIITSRDSILCVGAKVLRNRADISLLHDVQAADDRLVIVVVVMDRSLVPSVCRDAPQR